MRSQLPVTAKKRHFSNKLIGGNRAFIIPAENKKKTLKISFVLPKYFSMVALSIAVDALKTANSIHAQDLFSIDFFGLDSLQIKSDLDFLITAERPLIDVGTESDVIIVCGGLRCDLNENTSLTKQLQLASHKGAIICGIWNGAIALAYAGLLKDTECALHPESHSFMKEYYGDIRLSNKAMVSGTSIYSCADAASTMEMMLHLISAIQGEDVMKPVKSIIGHDVDISRVDVLDSPLLPEKLRGIIQLMASNLEEPLSIEELVQYGSASRRQIERLFKRYLNTSPSRYYLEFRITHARRLLLQSNASMMDIAFASGFSTSSHFSNCFKSFFGESPSKIRENYYREV